MHVAVGAICDDQGRVLLARRASHLHQGGLWEYPGGKVHADESPAQALRRELHEELGIDVRACLPLITIPYAYADRDVVLHVFEVTTFNGVPHGREGQPLAWVARHELHGYPVPAANRGITLALTLPDRYLVTPEPGDDWPAFLTHLGHCLASGVVLIQLRARALASESFRQLVPLVLSVVRAYPDARLLLNSHVHLVRELGADGVHLTATQLSTLRQRPLPDEFLVAASCHNREEAKLALALRADFMVLGPVRPTATHPDATPLTWRGFENIAAAAPIPVYALGGMRPGDIEFAREHGGQGIAAITGLWVDGGG
jgi:8-oxo-dGTP diphosphatase